MGAVHNMLHNILRAGRELLIADSQGQAADLGISKALGIVPRKSAFKKYFLCRPHFENNRIL